MTFYRKLNQVSSRQARSGQVKSRHVNQSKLRHFQSCQVKSGYFKSSMISPPTLYLLTSCLPTSPLTGLQSHWPPHYSKVPKSRSLLMLLSEMLPPEIPMTCSLTSFSSILNVTFSVSLAFLPYLILQPSSTNTF